MPEEKKKDSFTFSDKIKNSKPASSKSFANRLSSKIGSDGKPKQTLVERTKRDAPFFIAALLALLLLPFLYKYSGQVNEEPNMVTPSFEDAIVNPDRSGFDSALGDFEGQIAQLSGRDSLDLIAPWNKDKKTEDESLSSFDRSGLSDDYESDSSAGRFSSNSDMDEENHTINEYHYRKKAAPATRAAFKRSATKINRLGSSGLNARGGGKLGVGMWGGGLKSAAKKVSGPKPQNSVKPVSLQPLQAAGKPSRSYFGNGNAGEARRSKDAMSKGNAMQALMDAQMKPVEPGKIGGLEGGNWGGPGGGNGDLKREFNYNGKEPWWWDMMKTRAQAEWQKKFDYKWGWIDWATDIAKNILGGIANCLITGNDDGDMGTMFGAEAGTTKESKCGKYTKETWPEGAKHDYGEFGKAACWGLYKYNGKDKKNDPWQDGRSNSASLGFFGQRLDCLSNGLTARLASKWGSDKATNLGEASNCNNLATNGVYDFVFDSKKGKEDKWTTFHYVVGVRNNADLVSYYEQRTKVSDEDLAELTRTNKEYNKKGNGTSVEQSKLLYVLYIGQGSHFDLNSKVAKDIQGIPLFVEGFAIKNRKIKKRSHVDAKTDATTRTTTAKVDGKNESSIDDGWDVEEINAIAKDKAKLEGGYTYAEFKNALAKGKILLPIEKKGQVARSSKRAKINSSVAIGGRCAYPFVRVSCQNNAVIANGVGDSQANYAFAHILVANGNRQKANYDIIKSKYAIKFSVAGDSHEEVIRDAEGKEKTIMVPNMHVADHLTIMGADQGIFEEANGESKDKWTETEQYKGYETLFVDLAKLQANTAKTITWKIYQCDGPATSNGSQITNGGCNTTDALQVVSEATCSYDPSAAQSITVRRGRCDGLTGDAKKECDCNESGAPWKWDEETKECVDTSKCSLKKTQAAKDECCKDKLGPDAIWSDEEGKCIVPVQKPGEPPAKSVPLVTKFARQFTWIPLISTDRDEIQEDPAPEYFRGTKLASGNDTQHCGDTAGLEVMQTSAAAKFVKDVAKAYDDNDHKKMIWDDPEGNRRPTAGEFVDALFVANQQIPNAKVSAQAVCDLARVMTRISHDPDVNSFHNELGAYLVYVGKEAVGYPAPVTYDENGGQTCDTRFLTTDDNSVMTCKGNSKLAWKFHHNNYTIKGRNNSGQSYNGVKTYTKSRDEKIGFSDFPLAGLSKGINIDFMNCDSGSSTKSNSCAKLRSQYKNDYKYLLQDSSTSDDHCSDAANLPDLKVADVVRYVTTACDKGLNIKPWGVGGDMTSSQRGPGGSYDNGSKHDRQGDNQVRKPTNQ